MNLPNYKSVKQSVRMRNSKKGTFLALKRIGDNLELFAKLLMKMLLPYPHQ